MESNYKCIIIILIYTLFSIYVIYKLYKLLNSKKSKKESFLIKTNNSSNNLDISKYFDDKKIIITGLVRNSESNIYDSILFLYAQVIPHFKDYIILVYESDSDDNTRKILLEQSKKDPKFKVMGCGDKENQEICNLALLETEIRNRRSRRINKMVYLRNMYVDEIKKHHYSDYDFVLVYDFDLRANFVTNSMLNTAYHFDNNEKIDGICAYGVDSRTSKYYDTYAYKSSEHEGSRPTKSGLEKVDSCFGGFTIYKRIPFIYAKYFTYKDSYDNNNVVCEHTGFNSNFSNLYSNNDMVLLIGEIDVGIKCEKAYEYDYDDYY